MSDSDLDTFDSMTEVAKLLIDWKFSEETQLAFQNAKTELHEFLNMGLQSLQEFVPSDDERLELIKCIFKYKAKKPQSTKEHDINSSSSLNSPDNVDLDYVPDEILNSNSSSSEDERRVKKSVSKHCIQTSNKILDKTLPTSPHQANSLPDQATSSAQPGNLPSRLQSYINKNCFSNLDLEKFLRSSKSSEAILTDTGNKNGLLTDKNRKLLCKFLSEYMLNIKRCPEKEDYITVRNKIYELFPKEPEGLYYVAPLEEANRLARGKLFDAVRNKTNHLINGNVFEPLRKRKKNSDSLNEETEQPQAPPTAVKVALTVLKRPLEVTSEVEEKWRITADYRLEDLYATAKKVRPSKRPKPKTAKATQSKENDEPVPDIIKQYFEEYKILKNPKGYTLLLADFNHLHQNETQNLFSVWPDLQKKLETLALNSTSIWDPVGIKLVSRLKAEDWHLLDEKFSAAVKTEHGDGSKQGYPKSLTSVQTILSHVLKVFQFSNKFSSGSAIEMHFLFDNANFAIPSCNQNKDNKDAVLFQLLPSLCPPTARVTVGTRNFKPSVIESRDAFICHTTVGADIESLMNRRRELMATLKAPIQPYMIFLGPTMWDILAVYVIIDNVMYKVSSVLECIDTCFKAFHSLCASYPMEANHLWHFLHLSVYKIKHNSALEGPVPLSTKSFVASVESQ